MIVIGVLNDFLIMEIMRKIAPNHSKCTVEYVYLSFIINYESL